jgi:hypothetical protein
MNRPKIVCLCGSTRFYEAFQLANYEETMAGRIVLTVGFYPHSQEQAHHESVGCTSEQKKALDQLHLRKIDLADEVLVLNVKQPRCATCKAWFRHAPNGTVWQTCDCGGGPHHAPREDVGYVGDSTRGEIAYTRQLGKPIRWLEPVDDPGRPS